MKAQSEAHEEKGHFCSPPIHAIIYINMAALQATDRVFRNVSPGKAAQWLARSIRES
jgi:hypothetical protein